MRAENQETARFTVAQTPAIAGAIESHISAVTLEEYSLNKISESRVSMVEEHVQACAVCRARLEAIEPVNFIHFTEDGPIYSRATKLGAGSVMARHWGKQLDGIRDCVSVSAAKRYLTQSFFQMFPEHRCKSKCGPAQDRRGVRY